ncbi:MAG TPA: D-glycerate dehydrogenase [Xanthobacteraceae bacterium]|nr:D-glycerate dehydrogenase [Xanthobacteraceae bacterium]
MTRIFVSQPVHESALARLTAIAAVTSNPDSRQILPRDQLIAGVRGCDILFSLLHDRIDREVIEANPDLRAIASMSITPDNIDVAAATARGIPVTVVPALAVESTADTHFALLLAVARRVVEGDQLVRSGIFPGSQANYLLGSGVYGKTIGLVGGRGRIGRAVAARAKGFSMRILYCGPHPMEKAEEEALGAVYVPLDRLLAEADFVSLHPSLTDETRHMIDARALALMKPTAFLINTARGAVVDEAALVDALSEKRIAGAGLDVFENEPEINPALRKLPNVTMTPHLGSAVFEVREAMANAVVDNIVALLEGRRPPNIVNPEVLP